MYLHDAIPSSEVYAAMRRHHVIVLLSDYEGTPLVLLEGMANGLVPVVKDIGGGVGDLVKHGFNGYVVRDRDSEFQDAIARLAGDRDEWATLSRNARKTVEEGYAVDVMADGWIAMCEELAAQGRQSSIEVPREVSIPEDHRLDSLRFFHWHTDLLAKAYADLRHEVARLRAPSRRT